MEEPSKSTVDMFLKISKCAACSWCCVLEFCFAVLYTFHKTGEAESNNQGSAGAISSCQLYNLETNLSIWLKNIVINKQKSSHVMDMLLNLGFAPQIMVKLLTSQP